MQHLLRSRLRVIALGLVALAIATSTWLLAGPREEGADIGVVEVKEGEFQVLITTSGELRAPKSVQITAPANAQQAGAFQMKIQSIIPEGTIVKEGDVVADLDRSTLATQMQDVTLSLAKAQALFQQAQLDTTLTLSQAREDLRNMELSLEERRIQKEQAIYEAPSVRRQADIDFEKATRGFAKAKEDYKTKGEQALAKMAEVGADLARQKSRLDALQAVMGAFTIRSPGSGMLIYVKEWNGRKKGVGSQVTPWDPVVATLPDMSEMESITFVNEIDVRKLAINQTVRITLDADPNKMLEGTVIQVANVGEQRPNSDSKVFEVRVRVEQPDTTLRPGMTTSNAILTHQIDKALFIPLEAVFSDSGTAFVYKRSGSRLVRQEIVTGAMNDDEIVVEQGLSAGEKVLMSPPTDGLRLPLLRIEGRAPQPASPGDSASRSTVPVKDATSN